MKKIYLLSIFVLAGIAASAQFTPGRVVVSRVGNPTTQTPLAATTINLSLFQFNRLTEAQTLGTAIVSLNATGTDKLTVYGATAHSGQVTLSNDRTTLIVPGYDQNTLATATTANGGIKVIATINSAGSVDYTTKLPAPVTAGQILGAVSNTGSQFWFNASNATQNNYMGYATLGQTSFATNLNSTGPGRASRIFANQLFVIRGFGDILAYNGTSGLPSSTVTTAIAVPLSTTLSGGDFVFFDTDASTTTGWNGTGLDLLYVTNINSGLEKYYWDNTNLTWVAANSQHSLQFNITNGGTGYTIAPTVTVGTQWTSGATYALNDYIINGANAYRVSTAGTSGTAAPTHTSGTVAATGGTASLANIGLTNLATAIISGGAVTNIIFTRRGAASVSPLSVPVISFTGGDGSGVAATASYPNNTVSGTYGSFSQMTGTLENGVPVLYATSGNGTGSNNNLVRIVDNSGRTATITTLAATTLASAGADYAFRGVSFSPGSTDVVLPITLTTFSGSLINNAAALRWSTASESNSKEFVIERSNRGVDFVAVGTVKSTNTNNTTNYSFKDASLLSGDNYYRLKMVDNDGTFEYSKNIVAIKSSLSSTIEVLAYPNPTQGPLTINHGVGTIKGTITIIDLGGKKVAEFGINAGSTQTSINVSNIPAGNYFINVNNDVVKTIKLIKN